jgi:hypothetical protein
MIKIRDIRAKDRGKIYELMQQDEKYKAEEVEVTLHRIDLYLFDPDQRLYRAIIAEDEHKELMGYALYGPDPRAVGTYQVYNLVHSPLIKNGEILLYILQYIENELLKYKGRIIVIELSSHSRYKNQYETCMKKNYNLSSKISDFYSEGEAKLILSKNLA